MDSGNYCYLEDEKEMGVELAILTNEGHGLWFNRCFDVSIFGQTLFPAIACVLGGQKPALTHKVHIPHHLYQK